MKKAILNAKITIEFKAENLIDQEALDNWNDKGDGISLAEYIKMIIYDENMLFDIIESNKEDYHLVEVKSY